VPTIDGSVTMAVPKGSNTGSTLRLKGKGVMDTKSDQHGDQYVHLRVVLPKESDADLEECLRRWQAELRRWQAEHPYNPRAELGAGR